MIPFICEYVPHAILTPNDRCIPEMVVFIYFVHEILSIFVLFPILYSLYLCHKGLVSRKIY